MLPNTPPQSTATSSSAATNAQATTTSKAVPDSLSDCVRILTYDHDDQRKEVKFFFDMQRLCKSCEFFKTALSGEWSETQTQTQIDEGKAANDSQRQIPIPTITFPEDRPEIVKTALFFLETGCVHPRKGIALELCRFADRLGIKGIIKKCERNLASEASSGDPVEYLNFAETHGLAEAYRCASIALLSQRSSDFDIPTSLSAKTAKKLTTYREIFNIAVARMTLETVKVRLDRYNTLLPTEQDAMLVLLNIALLADVNNISQVGSDGSSSATHCTGAVILTWLTTNDGLKLQCDPIVPYWANVSAVEELHRSVLMSTHLCGTTPLIQRVRCLVHKVLERVKTSEEK